jgi:3-hydroxybutyryl-CoA dehydrogenase
MTKSVGVVGAGTMGRGIAHTLLRSEYAVALVDSFPEALGEAQQAIASGLARDVEKGRLSEEARQQALGRLRTSSETDAVSQASFVIEAVSERFETKTEVYRKLEVYCPSETIFATNTSSISITRLAAISGRPARFLGLHFFNPVPVMKLVEVVAGVDTLPETVEAAAEFVRSLGKTPVRVNDFPGFVSNRLLMPMINEAAFAVMEGVADAKAVDDVMKLGMNHPMGPLELADFIGLDVCLDIMRVLYDGFHDAKYRPCPLLERMVYAGRLGRKSGRGFFSYS